MQLIDTHTHLYLPEFQKDRDDVVAKALQQGVIKLLMPNIDVNSVTEMLSAETRYPGICHSMIGLHPTSVKGDYLSQLEKIEDYGRKHNFCAIGEIGIDLYWDKSHLKEQISAFKRQVEYAINKKLPVAVHSRESFHEIFRTLEDFKGSGLKGVFHAFTGSIDEAKRAIEIGFKLGIGGIVTFKNSGLDRVLKAVGIENIVLETDSPYLAPSPYRGKRNESSYLCIINRKVSEICGMDEENVASVTSSNAVKLFGL